MWCIRLWPAPRHSTRLAIAALATVVSVLGGTGIAVADAEREEAEYLALADGFYDARTLRPTEEAVQAILDGLRQIRAQHPEVGQIRARVPPRTTVMLQMSAAVTGPSCPPPPRPPQPVRPAALSVPPVDLLTRQFGGSYRIQCGSPGFAFVLVDFPQLLHLPSLLDLYRRTGAVLAADDDRLFGDGNDVTVTRRGRAWDVTVSRGWGDCLAGCIHREDVLFRVEPGGSVTKVGERRR